MTWNRSTSRFVPAVVVMLALPSAAVAAPNQPVGATPAAAFGIEANFVVDDTATNYGPQALVTGSAPGPFDNKIDVAHLHDTVALFATRPVQALTVSGQDLKSQVESTGIQIDSLSTMSNASLGSASVSLDDIPLGNTFMPAPLLTVTGSDIHSDTKVTTVFPNSSTVTAGASFGSLEITGTLLGNLKLHYAGTAKPNTVIYDTPTMTITLDRQIKAGIISCDPQCTFTVTMVATDAVDITLYKAHWGGHTVSGDIVLGDTNVQSQ